MQVNPREIADLATFTEEILNRKLHFLCSGPEYQRKQKDILLYEIS